MIQLGSLWAAVAVVTSLAFANPLHKRFNYQIKETHNPPRQWTRIGPAPANAVLSLHIGLKMGNWEELERNLHESTEPRRIAYIPTVHRNEFNQRNLYFSSMSKTRRADDTHS
jgi:tripeptidyl-peptidase-1